MNYGQFIGELKPLLQEASTLLDDPETHKSPPFRKWCHNLTTTINLIEDQGYTIDCGIEGRWFVVPSYGSVSKAGQISRFNQEIQDTINELEVIIGYYDKYGDPQISNLNEEGDQRHNELVWPDKMTFSWLFSHAPIILWLQFLGILVTVFLLGLGFSQTPAYSSIKKLWQSQEIESSEDKKPNNQPLQDTSLPWEK